MYKIILLLLTISLCSCQSLNSRGIRIENDKIDQLKVEKISKAQVVEIIGEPTIIPDYTPNTWYYVSRIVQNKTWSKPYVKKQTVVKVTFKDDYVSNVEVLDNKHKNINVTKTYTKLQGNDESAVQNFVKNFGRFNKTSRSKRR